MTFFPLFLLSKAPPTVYDEEDDDEAEAKPSKYAKAYTSMEHELGIPEALVFKPQVSISLWQDDARQEFVSVAIAMPAGITERNDTKVRVLDDLTSIRVDIGIPPILGNPIELHRYWEKIGKPLAPDCPRIKGHQDFQASIKNREVDKIYSTAVICLPIQVQKKILKIYRYGTWKLGSVLYIDLEGSSKSEYKLDDGDEFVMLDITPIKKCKTLF